MSLTTSRPQELPQPQSRSSLRTILRSRGTFIGLQVLDLATTLAAFHYGAFEVNPLVAGLTQHLGRFRGVAASKLMAVFVALGVNRLVWIVNLFYAGVVVWNILILIALSAKSR
jgi:hypothetical protein